MVLAAAVSPTSADAPSFSTKPTATKAGDGTVRVAFAVDRPIDVEVAVLDAGGKVVRHLAAEGDAVRIAFTASRSCDAEVVVLDATGEEVRHLAAGLLGAREVAAPLAPEKLEQSLLWDRKDDWGRPVAGSAFKVRVRLGMKAAGARPLLKAEKGATPASNGAVLVDPNPAEAGRPGITAEELATKEGKDAATLWYYGWRLMADREDDRLTDEGKSVKGEQIDLKADGDYQGLPYPQGVNPNGDFFFRTLTGSLDYDAFVSACVYRAESGKIEPTKLRDNGVIGKDGLLYFGKYQGNAVSRMDASGKAAPFAATGQWSEPYNDSRFYDRRSSWHVLPSGDIWAFAANDKEKPYRGVRVATLGPDGKVKQKDLVVGLQGPSSLRVDSRGNIFVADGLTLDGQPYPPEIDAFAKRLACRDVATGVSAEVRLK